MEEAPVVVTASTGALGPVVANLSTLLRRDGKYKLRRGTRKDIKLIRSKLKSIHSILWVIWEREDLDAEGKELRMEAWRLADDMYDAIDDFVLSMIKRSNDHGRRFIQAKIQPSPFQDLKRRADDVWERCRKKWKKMETAQTTIVSTLFLRTKATVDDSGLAKWRRVVDPYVHKDISKLVDMEEPRDKLIEHLVGEEETTPQLKMASILGAAGMGKTTLARLVYEAIEDKFNARAFVSVTSCHNMTEVLASIYQQVGLAHTTVVPLAGTKAATAEKHLIDDISNFLKDKRYLVIIDDIWHCGEWETIKKSLPNNNLGSRIVTTSRVNAITDKWRDDFDALVHKIDHSPRRPLVLLGRRRRTLPLTKKMIDMNADMVGEGFDHGHGIVNMCHAMPLAVACMLSALAKERERREQQGLYVLGTPALQDEILKQVMGNGIQKTPGFEPLVESLELGYKDLSHHMLKTCLLYSSIYPEDHQFERDGLVRRWLAEGFVCTKEAAEDYFDELVSRGWFQELKGQDKLDPLIEESVSWDIADFMYRYKLHPMIRNHLRRKLREDNFITCNSDGVPSSPVGRLCIDYWPSSDSVDTLSAIDWHHIRCLVVFKDAEKVPYKHLQHLRVLDVQCNHVLENQHLKDMCGLLRLRHLLVSGGLRKEGITEMPAEIARLQHLETLEVHGTEIRRLPAEIGDLKQLKTLDMSGNSELTEMPREMGNLQHLETLITRGSKITEQAWEIILTLKKLKTLDVSGNHCLSGIPRDIGEMQQLTKLDVRQNRGITKLPKEIGKLQHLETLDVSGTGITELPREIGNLQQLEALYLSEVETISKLPRGIGKLQHLERLNLRRTNVRKIPREIGGLKKLNYLNAKVGTLPFEAGQLSKLEELPKCVQKAWKNSDLVSSLAEEILSFQFQATGRIGDGGLVVGTKHMHIPQWIKEHFNNIGTLDIRICKVEEHDLKILREMPNLWWLKLRFEAVPRKPIAISTEGFAKLWYLVVDSRVPPRITFQEGAMPSLGWLEFEFQFYGGPPNTDPMGIKHLVSLEQVRFQCKEWYRADRPCISATIDVVRKEAQEHPKIISFTVSGKDTEYFPENSITQSSQDRNEVCSSSGAQRDRGDPSLIHLQHNTCQATDHYDLDLDTTRSSVSDFHHVYVYLLDIFYSKGIDVITSLILRIQKDAC